MNRTFFKAFLVLVLLAAIAGLGAFAYQAGVAQGLAQGVAQSAQLQPGELPVPLVPPYARMGYGHPYFGFGLLSCLGPLFLLFLVFAALRGLFWHRYSSWGGVHHGPWSRRDWQGEVPPMVHEWHRKMHAEPGSPASAQSPSDQV